MAETPPDEHEYESASSSSSSSPLPPQPLSSSSDEFAPSFSSSEMERDGSSDEEHRPRILGQDDAVLGLLIVLIKEDDETDDEFSSYDPSAFSSDGGENEANGGNGALFDSVSNTTEDSMCVVCLETMRAEEEVKKLPCNHVYHKDCIILWLRWGNSCPLCRRPLDDAEQYEYDDESAYSFSSSELSSVSSEEDEAGYFDEME